MNIDDLTKEELLKELVELKQKANLTEKSLENEISALRDDYKKLSRSEEIFRLAYMTSSASININRLSDGMYISVNEGFTNILGYSEEETIGRTSLEMNIWVNPADRVELVKEVEAKGKVKNYESKFLSKDGRIINGLLSASLINLEGVPHLLSIVRDITKRKQAEEYLAKEQFLITALMNNLPDHIYFKDRESRFIRNSKSHAESFGFNSPDQLIGKSDFDFFSAEAAQQAFEDEQIIINSGQPVFKEEKLTRKDNSIAWFSAMKLPLRDTEGNIVGTFGISRDITEKKMAEEALQHSEERFRSLAQSANDAIITTDNQGIVLGWNRGAINIFGFEEAEILGKLLNLIIPSEYLDLHTNALKRVKTSDEKRVIGKTVELNGLKKDGTNFPLELSLSEWETSEGKFFTGIVRDITIRKRTQLENQINYEISQGITSTSNLDELLMLIHHALGKVVYAENCFIALHDSKTNLFTFPYFVDKVDTTPLPTSMKKSCTAYVFRTVKPLLLTQTIFDELVEGGEVELVGSNSPSWVGIPLQTPSQVIGVLVLQHYEKENVFSETDIKFLISIGSQIAMAIERKKSEEEINMKNELLQAINAEKDKFFSILAHDLRGPLSAFVAATQIITEEIQTMTFEEIKDITMSMKTSATNIYGLLENLLEWSRLRRGGMDFVPQKLNLTKNITECINVLSESANKKKIEISIEIPDELDVIADSHMFESVLRNLISNSLKFTNIGGKVRIRAFKNADNLVEISISDSGIGMTPELKGKLFQINEKTSRQGTEGETSTGLGLLLCKEFIERHNGKIWVESEVGKGSTFSLALRG